MATWRTQPVIEDLGSEEVKKLVRSYNGLLDAVGDLVDALESAAAVGDINTAATAFLAAVESNTATAVKIGREPGVPERPSRPVTS